MYQKWSYRILESLRFLWSIHLEFWNILLRFWVILSQIIAVGCQIAIMTVRQASPWPPPPPQRVGEPSLLWLRQLAVSSAKFPAPCAASSQQLPWTCRTQGHHDRWNLGFRSFLQHVLFKIIKLDRDPKTSCFKFHQCVQIYSPGGDSGIWKLMETPYIYIYNSHNKSER